MCLIKRWWFQHVVDNWCLWCYVPQGGGVLSSVNSKAGSNVWAAGKMSGTSMVSTTTYSHSHLVILELWSYAFIAVMKIM
jgi:hypothetical protein